MNSSEKKQLKIAACKVRMGVIEGVFHAKSGHPGGSLSASDLYTYLYFAEMNVDPKESEVGLTGTVLVLSKGHLRARARMRRSHCSGYFPMEELEVPASRSAQCCRATPT